MGYSGTLLVTSLIICHRCPMTIKIEKRNQARLRISSSALSAAEISAVISAKPTEILEKGKFKSKDGKERVHADSKVFYDSLLDETKPIEEHVQYLLDFVEKHISEFKNLSKEYSIDIWCSVFSQAESGFVGICLDKVLMGRASKLGLDLIVSAWVGAD